MINVTYQDIVLSNLPTAAGSSWITLRAPSTSIKHYNTKMPYSEMPRTETSCSLSFLLPSDQARVGWGGHSGARRDKGLCPPPQCLQFKSDRESWH